MYKFFLFILLTFSCSGRRPTRVEPDIKTQEAEVKIDFQALIHEVELLRDLNFKSRPQIVVVEKIDQKVPQNIDAQYQFLREVFSGPPSANDEAEFGAVYRKKNHRIEYLRQEKVEDEEKAIFMALVLALDAQQKGTSFDEDNLDHYLANQVRRRSVGSFLWVLRTLQKSTPHLSKARIALRPSAWLMDRALSGDIVKKFTFRNALLFGAAMYRSNRIPGLEYGLLNGPSSSGEIKRPDRWLAGEGISQWTLAQMDPPQGFTFLHEGQIGPLFLERVMGIYPALSFWQGGRYRAYHKGDSTKKGTWIFEWVTMWETPTAATVAGEMFRDFFAKKEAEEKRGVRFSVVEKGNVLAISVSLGASTTLSKKIELERASALSESQVVFYSIEKPFLNFVPTAKDLLVSLKSNRKDLSAPGAIFQEKHVEGWKVEKPQGGLWWYATLGKEAIIQCNVELRSLEDRAFDSEEYGEKWFSNFRSTVEHVQSAKVEKIDWNGVPGWEIDMEGQRSEADASRRIISRQYAYGEFVVSVSLVSNPDSKMAIQTFKNLVDEAILRAQKNEN